MPFERWWYAWRVRIRRLVAPSAADAELSEELQSHVEQEAATRRAQGASADEAHRLALARLGGVESTKEAVRDVRPGAGLEQLVQDVRYGLRTLRRNPGFGLATVLTLTLGIGAATTIFSVIDAVLLQPPPFPEPERLVTVWQTDPQNGQAPADVAPGNFLDWHDQVEGFEHLAAIEPWSLDYTGDDEPVVVLTGLVSAGFFEALGIGAARGRTFLPQEYEASAAPVVVLTHGLWQRRFGGDPDLVGRTLTLDTSPHTVVGILPPGFELSLRAREHEAFVPKVFQEYEAQIRGGGWWHVIGRLEAGTSLAEAQAEMTTVAGRLAADHPRTNEDVGALVVPLHTRQVGDLQPALLLLAGAVLFLLLIACVNVANLMLARCMRREQEFALRTALGGGRGRLLRQLLTESFVVAAAGGLGGIVLSRYAIDLIVALTPDGVPRLDAMALDGRVLAFATAVVVLTALAFGAAPARLASRTDRTGVATEGHRVGASVGQRRLRSTLVAVEVAMALVLLVGAGLMLRSFDRLTSVDLGFVPQNMVALQVFAWDRNDDGAARAQFIRQTLDRVRAQPGVEDAGAVSSFGLGLANVTTQTPFTIHGRPTPPVGEEPGTYLSIATPRYLETMGIALRAGRWFETRDDADRPDVGVVNEAMARRYWPTDDPVLERLTVRIPGADPVDVEIVGVVADMRPQGFDSSARPELYLPHAQQPTGSMTYVVRAAGDQASVVPMVQNAIWSVDPLQTFYSVATVDQLLGDLLATRRLVTILLSVFGLVALTLAAIGIYGVIAIATSQRTHEIGLRVALGARPSDITAMVVRGAVTLAGIGVAAGLVSALWLSRALATLLYEVAPTDGLTLATVSGTLLAVAAAAAYLPARRALRVDPLTALRVE